MKNMIWIVCGIKAVKHGNMNTNTVAAAKLCVHYMQEKTGFMIIFGKAERLKFESDRENYSKEVQKIYDEAQTYHDGKWMMFEPSDTSLFSDFTELLKIKRKPNKK